jgi:ADP-heptose:LPS heptosyltransferase
VPPADRRRPLLVALRPLGLGDLLTGVPALRALARAFPGHERVLACPAVLEPLALAIGAVDRVVHTQPLVPLGPALRGADIAVDMHGKGPASQRILLASGPHRLVAFANAEVPATAGMPEWRAEEHEVTRWCRMLSEHGIKADPHDLHLDASSASVPRAAVGATIVHPGAASEARRWPPERFAEVARAELARGRVVLYTGRAVERPLAASVRQLAGGGTVFAGGTSLAALAGLVRVAGRVVCGDTGVAHLATALRTPSVVLFGPTSPTHWGPPAGEPRHRVLWAGATGDPHAAEPHIGLLAITVASVLDALASLDESRRSMRVTNAPPREVQTEVMKPVSHVPRLARPPFPGAGFAGNLWESREAGCARDTLSSPRQRGMSAGA